MVGWETRPESFRVNYSKRFDYYTVKQQENCLKLSCDKYPVKIHLGNKTN